MLGSVPKVLVKGRYFLSPNFVFKELSRSYYGEDLAVLPCLKIR